MHKAFHGISADAYGAVLPMTEAALAVYIFVGKVNTAGVCTFTVYHGNFSVVPVVVICGQKRLYRRKNTTFDFVLSDVVGKIRRRAL